MASEDTDDNELEVSKAELIGLLAEKNLALKIVQIFHEALPIKESLSRVLLELCKHSNTQIAEIWLGGMDGKTLRLVAQVGVHQPVEEKKEILPNEGLIGEAWTSKQRQEIDFIRQSYRFVQPHLAKANNLIYGMAIPVIYDQDVMAVMGLYSKRPKGNDPSHCISPFIVAQLAGEIKRKKIEDGLQLFFSSSPDLLAIAKSNGYLKKVNPEFTNLLGYSETELLSRPFMELVHPHDCALLQEKVRQLSRWTGVRAFNVRLITKENKIKWITWTGTSLPEEGLMFGIGRDITAQIELEQAVAAEQHRFKKMFVEAPVSMCILKGRDHVFQSANEQYYKLSGRDRRIIGMKVRDVYPELEGQRYFEWLDQVYRNGETLSLQETPLLIDVDGSGRMQSKFITFMFQPYRNEQGQVEGIFYFGVDVTEKKKAEEELEKLSLIAQKTINAVIVTNANREIEWVNKAFVQLMEFTLEEVANKKVEDILHGPETDPSIRNYIHRQIEKSQPFQCELIKYTKSGKPIWMDIEGQPIFDDNGNLTHYFEIVTDITEQKKIIQELIKSKEEVSHFARQLNVILEDERARIAREIHDEFGQQLTGLKMSLASLNQFEADSLASVSITSMVNSVENSIRSLRNFSTELRPGILDTLGLISTLDWLTSEFQRKNNIKCRFIASAHNFDRGSEAAISLFRICQEALTNIAKHAGATAVIVKAITLDNGFYLEIKDNGCGISNEKLSNPFSMGLLGMRERSRLLNADFKISSKENEGTTVKVKMPIT